MSSTTNTPAAQLQNADFRIKEWEVDGIYTVATKYDGRIFRVSFHKSNYSGWSYDYVAKAHAMVKQAVIIHAAKRFAQ